MRCPVKRPVVPDLYADPFRERIARPMHFECDLLGTRFRFESDSQLLLQLARDAYQGLPAQRFRGGPIKPLTLQLLQRPAAGARGYRRGEPPALDMFSTPGWLGAGTVASDVVLLSPSLRAGIVAVSPRTLTFAYHTRYELIEFAAFTLASRCQRLASLHAGCVGRAGQGVLLMGDSGAGKSTVTMLCLQRGLEFLSEDSVFVAPASMRATGVANFIHLRADSLQWLAPVLKASVRRSPVIRRRSGVRKYELDLRHGEHRLAQKPLRLRATVFLSARSAGRGTLLRPLRRRDTLVRLAAAQAYAVRQPGWPQFSRNLASLPAFELRRGTHPDQAVDALQALLD
jgi:hypothetical protein